MMPAVRRNRRPLARLEQLEGREVPALFTALSPQTVASLDNAGFVAAGDFNADGLADVVMTNYGQDKPGTGKMGRTLTVLRGRGDGTFGNTLNLTVGDDQYVTFAAVDDVNGDGKQDIVCTSNGDSDPNPVGKLTVFLGNGAGGFTKAAGTPEPTGGNNSSWVGLGDVNGDDKLDAVVCSFGSISGGTVIGNNATVLAGDGQGGFGLLFTITNGIKFIPTAGALDDFNGDGKLDVAFTIPTVPPDESAPHGPGDVAIFLGEGDGQFAAGSAVESGGALPISIRSADLDADGRPDLVVGNAGDPHAAQLYVNFGENAGVGILRNTGGGNFETNSMVVGIGNGGAKSVFAVAVDDFDLDGKMDIASVLYGQPFASTNSRLLVYKGDGNMGFTNFAGSPFASGATDGQYLAVADVDGNGSKDVVLVGNTDSVVVYRNDTDVTPPAATSTTLASSGTPAVYGNGFTLTAAVTAATGDPSGKTVTFLRGGTTVLGTATVALVGGAYQATFTVPGTALAVGAYNLTARFEAAKGFAASTSANLPQDISVATPAVNLTVSNATPAAGDTVTLTAAVTSPAGTPAGSVTFFANGTLLGTRALSGTGVASFDAVGLTTGIHQITAKYLGQGNFGEKTSDPKTVTVSPAGAAATTTTLASGSPSAVYGAGFNLTAVVAGTGTGTAPTGTVTFKNGATVLGTAPLTAVGANGVATLSVGGTALDAGSHTLTAEYGGAAGFNPSAGTAPQTVTAATPTAGLTAAPGTAAAGQPVTLTATVSSPHGTPTGSVTFFDGIAALGTAPLAGGVATLTTTTLSVGGHILSARYLGEGNFGPKTSNDAAVTVTAVNNPPAKGEVAVAVTATPNPSTAGQAVTLLATVADISGHAAEPTGSITFTAGALILGTAPLAGQIATLTTTALPVGTVAITYAYSGDANFNGGGGTLSHTANAATSPPPVVVPPVVQPALLGYREFAVGAGAGREASAQFYNADGSQRFSLANLFPGSDGGVRVTSADFNGDGVAEVVAGTGPGGASQVRVIDGVSQRNLFTTGPFEATFVGGVFISTGDLTGDGVPDLIVSPDEGGGPRVMVYDGKTFTLAANFFGIDDPAFRGGARTATGDIDGDGRADLVVAAGFGGGPRVSAYNGTTVTAGRPVNLFGDMFMFEQALRNGIYVAVGDVNGDGHADLVGGGGPGGGPRVLGLSGKDLAAGAAPAELANFFAGNTDNRGGVRVAVKNLDGDGKADLVVGDGAGGGSRVTTYLGKALTTATMEFDAYPGFAGGVFVG